MMKKTLIICLLGGCFRMISSQLPPSCSSKIFCQGDILHMVQTRKILNETTNFVRFKMKTNETYILNKFDKLMVKTTDPSDESLLGFVNENFEIPDELENWTPNDLNENPAFLSKVNDEKLRYFGKQMVKLWPYLGRKVKADVVENSHQYTLIPVPNGFIIPGGMFKELYYWDSYWIIKGLIISEMTVTARGMIDNLLSLVRRVGFVPNGSRIYFLGRSQPPLLAAMAKLYMDASNDIQWLRQNIFSLEDELNFWLNNRTVEIANKDKSFIALRYNAVSAGPRPESYFFDYNNSMNLQSEEEKQIFFNNIKSAAESGWDFSTRWMRIDSLNLYDIETADIVPVDLNAFFAGALQIVGDFWRLLGVKHKAITYWISAEKWRSTISELFWDENQGVWFDYNIRTETKRKQFYPSNLSPLWAGAVEDAHIKQYGEKILSYLKDCGALNYVGGIPTSLVDSGQQWDLPNAWPPLQSIVLSALETIGTDEAKSLAVKVAEDWINSNYKGFLETGEMFEKYDANRPGLIGGGGEYTPQTGFGWSNGVVLEFLSIYGDRIKVRDVVRNKTQIGY